MPSAANNGNTYPRGSSPVLPTLASPDDDPVSPDKKRSTTTTARAAAAKLETLTLPFEFGNPKAADVVDRRELSQADISHMRLMGCRTHSRLSPRERSVSCLLPPAGVSGVLPQLPLSPAMPPSLDQRQQRPSGSSSPPPAGTADGEGVEMSSSVRRLAAWRPQRPTSLAQVQRSNSPNTRLGTSMRILERMAQDTAASAMGRSTSITGNMARSSIINTAAGGLGSLSRLPAGNDAGCSSPAAAEGVDGANASSGIPAADPTSPLRVTTTYTTNNPKFDTSSSPADLALVSSTSGADGMDAATPFEGSAGTREGDADHCFSVFGRREQSSVNTPDADMASPTTAVQSGLLVFARTTMNDDSLDNMTSPTTTSSSAMDGKDRATCRPSDSSKPSASVSLSVGDDPPVMPQILATAHHHHSHTSCTRDRPQVDGRCTAPGAVSGVLRDSGGANPTRSAANAAMLPPHPSPQDKSLGGESPTRPPPAALSVSELIFGHQIAFQHVQNGVIPRRIHSAIANTATSSTTVANASRVRSLTCSSSYPWLERHKMSSINNTGGAGPTTATATATTTTTLNHILHRSNHDLRNILSREDKEALTISIQPYEEVDEDAEVDPLDITRHTKKRRSQPSDREKSGINGSGDATQGGSQRRDGDEGLYGEEAGTPDSPMSQRHASQTADDLEESGSPSRVQPFQTWRFPMLGRADSPLLSPKAGSGTSGFRRESQTSSNPSPIASDARGRQGNGPSENQHLVANGSNRTSLLSDSRRGTKALACESAKDTTGQQQQQQQEASRSPAAASSHRDSWRRAGPLGPIASETPASPLPTNHAGSTRRDSSSYRTILSSSLTPSIQVSDPTTNADRPTAAGSSSLPTTSQSANTTLIGTNSTGDSTLNILQANLGNPDFVRRFEMVYAAYTKFGPVGPTTGADAWGSGNTTTTAALMGVSPYSSLAVTPSGTGRCRRILNLAAGAAYGTVTAQQPLNSLPQPHHTSGENPCYSPQAAANVLVGHTRQPSSVLTPAMSISGGLGRSAGYYSFGNRLSLHHPNRQSIPSTPQELQSFGYAHAGQRGGGGPGSVSPSMEGLHSRARPGGVPGSVTVDSLPSRRRSLDVVIAESIMRRPLLQTTVFLHYAQNQFRDVHERREREATEFRKSSLASQADAASTNATSPPDGKGNAADTSKAKTNAVSHTEDTRSGAKPVAVGHTAGVDSASRGGGVANRQHAQGTDLARQPGASSSHMHTPQLPFVPPSVSWLGSSSESGMIAHKSLSQPPHEAHGVNGATADAASPEGISPAGTEDDPEAAAGTSAISHPFSRQEPPPLPDITYSPPPPPPCYRRALTPFNTLVRHVHNIDGYEREVDNEDNDLVVYIGMRLMGWLEVVSLLGRGSFGQVFLCKDLRICDGHFIHPSEIEGDDYTYWNCCHAYLPFSDCDIPPTHAPLVAVKVVKSVPLYEQQSVLEAEMLVLIGAQTAQQGVPAAPDGSGATAAAYPDNVLASVGGAASSIGSPASAAMDPPLPDPRCANVAKVLADGTCFGHHCIVMERYGANLYEYVENNQHSGLPMYQIRSIGRQLLSALTLLHEECHIIHADIKPENMLLTMDSCRSAMSANHLQAAATPSVQQSAITPQYQPGQQQQQVSHGAVRPDRSLSSEPPRQHLRSEGRENGILERSYIKLSGGVGGDSACGTKTTVLLEAAPDVSAASISGHPGTGGSCSSKGSIGQSYRQLPLGGSHQNLNVSIAGTAAAPSVAAPEPQRVHALNQPRLASTRLTTPASLSLEGGRGTSTPAAGTGRAASVAATVSPDIPRLRIKLIDFSSSCYDGGPFYTYIQSRYYRAPEVIVQAGYGSPIDIWSTGCVLAELFLGMPLLPGENDHHQLSLIEEMLGPLPATLVESGAIAGLYYEPTRAEGGLSSPYNLISNEEYFQRNNLAPVTYTKYFNFKTLQELVRHCPLAVEERRMSNGEQPYPPAVPCPHNAPAAADAPNSSLNMTVRGELMKQRFYLFDLLRQLLNPNPDSRPTAAAALAHPFFSTTPTYMQHFALE